MAHSCPVCSCLCHCGGDIDDIEFDDTPEAMACTCCDDRDEGYPDDFEYEDRDDE